MNPIKALKQVTVCASLLASLLEVNGQAPDRPEENRFTKVVLQQKLEEPMQFQVMRDGKVLYAERKGKLKVFDPSTNKMSVIAEFNVSREYISKTGQRSEGEDGLQGVILHPDYINNHLIYVYYSSTVESVNRLSSFVWAGGKMDMRTEKKILDVAVQREECCHVGGGMVFDKDANLYLSTGDNTFSRSSDGFTPIDERPGESPRDAQKSSGNTNDLRGKILRIHPEKDGLYTIPEGNLFKKGTANTRPEIYTMGNRNPWRLTIDRKTGWLFWGEVGPDGSTSSDLRGPKSYDEFNLAKTSGNYGWPYFNGKEAYRDYDFATKQSGAWWDPQKPLNNSPNNTGLNELPPSIDPLIWYPYAASEEFPQVSSGGRSAVGGPIFYQSDFPKTATSIFPEYYEGKWLITDWVRGWILAVSLDADGKLVSIERFMPQLTLRGAIDMKFGPDGALYVLEYGNGYFKDNPEAELIKIEYNGGNRKPVVQATASKTAGALPLKIKLSSNGSSDADGDSLSYNWRITRNGVLVQNRKEANPEILFNQAGVYKAMLTVTDSKSSKNTKSLEIVAGNAVPEVAVNFKQGNSSFFFPGKTIRYEVSVSDKEDGSLNNKRISSSQVSVSMNYLSEGYDMTMVAQNQNLFDASAQHAGAKALINKSDCNSCHALKAKSLGPSFTQVSLKYSNDKTAENKLVKKIINGGSGVWGDAMMPAHSSLTSAEVKYIVKYVLSLSEKKALPKNLPVSGSYLTTEQTGQTNKGTYIFRAAYKDKGAKFAGSLLGESVVVLRNPKILVESVDESRGMEFNGTKSVATVKAKGAYLLLKQIDLNDITKLEISGTNRSPGEVKVRLDAVDGNIIAQGHPTGKETEPVSATINAGTGKHDVYLVFDTIGGQITSILIKGK